MPKPTIRVNGPVTNIPPIVKPSQTVNAPIIEYTDTGSNNNPGLAYSEVIKQPGTVPTGKTQTTDPVNPRVTAGKVTSTPTATSGGDGGSGGGGGSTPYVDPNQAVKDRYNQLLKNLSADNNQILKTLKKNYNNSQNVINANYDLTQGNAEQDSANALREAYINYMMNKRNAQDTMARQGMTGGLTESNMARMYNNYGTNRNNIQTTLANNLAKINAERNSNLAELLNQYNTARSNQMSNYYDKKTAIQRALANLLA